MIFSQGSGEGPVPSSGGHGGTSPQIHPDVAEVDDHAKHAKSYKRHHKAEIGGIERARMGFDEPGDSIANTLGQETLPRDQ